MRRVGFAKPFALLVFLALSLPLQAIENTGTSALNFLKLDIGGRAAGMAGAFAAVADDPSATLYNPAGLIQITKPAALFAHTRWIFDTRLNFAGVALPLGAYGSIGAAFYTFNSGDIRETTIYQPGGTGRYFQVNDYLVSLSYARQMTDRLTIGATAKWIREEILHEQAGAVAFDFGSLFWTGFLNTRLALVLSNFGSSVQFQGRDLIVDLPGGQEAYLRTLGWSLPLLFRVGISGIVQRQSLNALWSVELVDARDAPPRGNLGVEIGIADLLFLRGGYRIGYDTDRFTAGAGFHLQAPGLGNLSLDYAYHEMKPLGTASRISLTLRF